MASLAFVSSFTGGSGTYGLFKTYTRDISCRRERTYLLRHRRSCLRMLGERSEKRTEKQSAEHRQVIGIIGKSKGSGETNVAVDSKQQGIFGMKASAYWESIGVLPLFFAGFGIVALAIKMVKVKSGELRGGSTGVNKVTIPKTAITSEEEEKELHVFKCSGCGYEIYPARGREFKFFPDSFKCPLCQTPKSEFWDLNDPDDPRNQEPEDDDNGPDGGDESSPDGKTIVKMEDSKDRTE